jgi:outer membrane protein OmpA-like peptidoglycan-associated protein
MNLSGMSKAVPVTLLGLLLTLSGCQQAPLQTAALPAAVQVVPGVSPLGIVPTDTERRILLTVQFGFDEYSIRPESSQTLNNLVAAMKDQRLRGVSYEINGHTDLRGNLAHNIALSALRAKSVSNYLRDSGVQVPPIRAQGFGPLQLLYAAEPFNPGNRRVEIIALGP